ncbi:HET-domain-containing protein, partial [Lophiostoma macrostomum CBS 122681]
GPYASLSHCWGRNYFLRLTTTTIETFKAGVPFADFPVTFQHTITTVRALGIRYLWIDCYCIIQGNDKVSQTDWAREVDKMRDVYSHSFINIGAATTDNPFGGLFRARELHRNRTRAWVVQETALSNRMLTFTDEGLMWQCNWTAATEDFPLQMSDSDDEMKKSDFTTLIERWYRTLDAYRRARLTFPEKDTFPAIDGIARLLSTRMRDRYQHGVFSRSLVEGLIWSAKAEYEPCHGINIPGIPSWHWASYEGGVDF